MVARLISIVLLSLTYFHDFLYVSDINLLVVFDGNYLDLVHLLLLLQVLHTCTAHYY
jgi:hypothetical protein